MKVIAIVLTSLFLIVTAYAKAPAKKDRKPSSSGSWILCRSGGSYDNDFKPIASIYEHNNGASKRRTDITLIFGEYIMTGGFDSTNSNEGNIVLPSTSIKSASFKGMARIDSDSSVSIKGSFKVGKDETAYDQQLTCEVLKD